MKIGFNNEKYVKMQSERIKEKMNLFPERLYLEFGGKLFDDYHAARVLPGFELNAKIRLLQELKDEAEVIICVNAADLEQNRVRADHGITYDMEVFHLIDEIQTMELHVNSVVITLYQGQESAIKFQKKLEEKGIMTYIHQPTKGYPTDVEMIVSEEGYGANPYIEVTKRLVVVTAPGAGSGKLATCLSQLYHEYQFHMQSGYAKFETFPVWNLPLKHPINLAYEAATANIEDQNMLDYFHLDAYGIPSVNYNRDLEVFPILKNILFKITGKNIYASPTDMGVNTIKACITDEEVVIEASKQEIIRRYDKALVDWKLGILPIHVVDRIKLIMNELQLQELDRNVILPAREKAQKESRHVMALELPSGKIITGKQTELLNPVSSLILNALKELTHIPDEVDLISANILDPILTLNEKTLNQKNNGLGLQEVLIALSICSATNPIVEKALQTIHLLSGCEAHATYIVQPNDQKLLRILHINFTCDPVLELR